MHTAEEGKGGELVPLGVEALALAAADEREIRAVLDRYGYQGTTLDQLIHDTRRQVNQSTEAMLEIGRAVCCFRELGRGRYGEAIQAIGLSPTTANRLAVVALKFLGRDHRKPLLTLDRSKVYELALLDDHDLDELTADPQQLDQIERMSVSELRRELRRSRREHEQAAATAAQITRRRDERINELEEENIRLSGEYADRPPALRAEGELRGLLDDSLALVREIEHRFRFRFARIENLFPDGLIPAHVRLAQQQALCQVLQAARIVAGDSGIALTTADGPTPELDWLTQGEALFGGAAAGEAEDDLLGSHATRTPEA